MSQPTGLIEDTERAGVDLSLLDPDLSCSYERRAVLHQGALELALEIERAGRQLHGYVEPTSLPPL
jgi:hypothetical protein